MSDMVIYGHIWAYMIKYEHIRMDMSGWHVCKLLQHMPFSKLQSWKLSGARFQVSVKHEQPQQRSARFEEIQNISKHACFAFPNWRLQKRLVKNDSTIFKNLQTTRQVWKSCRFCRFFGLLDLAFLPFFSASWTTAGSVAITSNHKFFSAGSTVYCLLLWSVVIFYVMLDFVDDPPKFYLCDLWGKM